MLLLDKRLMQTPCLLSRHDIMACVYINTNDDFEKNGRYTWPATFTPNRVRAFVCGIPYYVIGLEWVWPIDGQIYLIDKKKQNGSLAELGRTQTCQTKVNVKLTHPPNLYLSNI